MTSYAVFSNPADRNISDIYEDELYHINNPNSLTHQSSSLGSGFNNSKMFDEFLNFSNNSDEQINVGGKSNSISNNSFSTKSNSGSSSSISEQNSSQSNRSSDFNDDFDMIDENNENTMVEPFNEYGNPDLRLFDENTFTNTVPRFNTYNDEMIFNVYEDFEQNNPKLMFSEKNTYDNFPSLHYYQTLEIPDEDLEDYESEDEDEDDYEEEDEIYNDYNIKENSLFTVGNREDYQFSDNKQDNSELNNNSSSVSTPNTSVLPSPSPKPYNKEINTAENIQTEYGNYNSSFAPESVIDDEEEEDDDTKTLKSMDLESDVSDYEDSLYAPKFDTAGLFERSARPSFINNHDEQLSQFRKNAHSNMFNSYGGKFKTQIAKNNSSLQKAKQRKNNLTVKQEQQENIQPSILKIESEGNYGSAQGNNGQTLSGSDDIDGHNQCMLTNPATGGLCFKKFSRPYDLIRHQETIHASKKKIFRCIICEKNYRNSLNNSTVAASTDNDSIDEESKPIHSPKTFSRGDALSRHIRVKHSLSGTAVADAIKYAKDHVEYVDIV